MAGSTAIGRFPSAPAAATTAAAAAELIVGLLHHHHHDVGGSFSESLVAETQAVFVPLDFRLRSFDVSATVTVGRRE